VCNRLSSLVPVVFFVVVTAVAVALMTAPSSECGIGPGARIFITKCYPAHGKLSQADFYQLRDAGFTVACNKWPEDLPTYFKRAARAGLDVATFSGAIVRPPDEGSQWIGRSGKPLNYACPTSAYQWEQLGNRLVEQAQLSLEYPNFKCAILDFEIYDQNKRDVAGFSESYDDATFNEFVAAHGLQVPAEVSAPGYNQRWKYLKDHGLLARYTEYQQELVRQQVLKIRPRIDEVNPRFQVGIYAWGSLLAPVFPALATEQAPVLAIQAHTYGRGPYTREHGYPADEPDRTGLKNNLIGNYLRAVASRNADYPRISLAGHYPQAKGPADGSQYKFTVRDSFNSVAAADGYWIWTDWGKPGGFEGSKQDWIDAMMAYWTEANAALDEGDWTWANRQPIQIPNPEATEPAYIVTLGNVAAGGEMVIWDPISGSELGAFGADADAPNVALACGDVLDNHAGDEIVAVTADGTVRFYRAGGQDIVGGFNTREFADEPAARVAVVNGRIFIGVDEGALAYEYDGTGKLVGEVEFPVVTGVLSSEEDKAVAVSILGGEARICDLESAELLKSVKVGHGLRALAIADVDTIAGNELITLNAGMVRYWHYPSGAPLLRFPVGQDCVDMAAGYFGLPGQQ